MSLPNNNEPTKAERKALKAQHRAEKERQNISNISSGYTDKITVLCVRFGNLYGRQYVERLRNMVSRHITVPYKFCCLTDDQHPIEGVETIYQPNAGYRKGWWHKVHMFDPSLNLGNRVLYFDLDVVVHKNIDKLVLDYDQEFLGIRDFNRKFYSSWKYLNSSVMSWVHGSQNHIWNDYKRDIASAQKLQGDQDWIWKTSSNRIKFWPDEWIQSYKWEIRSKNDLVVEHGKRKFKIIKDDTKIPPDCCVSVFHGDPKPQDIQDKFVIDNWR
jgi:hypothetical protein